MSVHVTTVISPVRWVLSTIRQRLIMASALAVIGTMLTLVPLVGMVAIARIALGGAGEVWPIFIASLVSLFAGMVLIFASELIAHLADNHLTHHLRLSVAKRLAQVPLGWFTSRASGDIKQVMQDDIATLHSLTAHFYTAVGRVVGAIFFSAIYLFVTDWRLSIVVVLPFLGFFIFLRRAMSASGARVQDFVEKLGQVNSAIIEFVNGIPIVKTFGVSGRAYTGYRDAVDDFALAFSGFARPLVRGMAHAHAMIAPVTVLALVLVFGALFIYAGWIAPLDIVPFALVAPGICAPVLLLHTLLHDLGSATGAAQRVMTLLNTPVISMPGLGQQQLPGRYDVCFENVGYHYEANYHALAGINFELKPGTVTAIVGPSGAGKSTIARLLLRFFDPTEGRITLGGIDLRQIESQALYQRVGFVLQEVQLIRASVRDNIALGKSAATLQEIENAARAANIHQRILDLPRGYDSVIGEDAQLSGGERQRVSIARAVLLDPPILVLDEATAASDASNEVAIQDALSRFAQHRTLMVIAHRLDTVRAADNIIFLDGGTILEQGSHEQLLALGKGYAKLWKQGGYDMSTSIEGLSC